MDRTAIETANRTFLREISARLEEAAGIARAADACAQAGNADKGVEVALDIEQLVYEATPSSGCRELTEATRAKLILPNPVLTPRQRPAPPRGFGGGGARCRQQRRIP